MKYGLKSSPRSINMVDSDVERKKAEDYVACHDLTGEETEIEAVSKDAQDGVQKIEATTLTWSRGALITAYIMYVCSLLAQAAGTDIS